MHKKIISWTMTGLISFFMLFSAYYSGTHRTEFTARLGFPNYFRIELTLAKIVGALLLLTPAVPARVREWIYVSFSIVLLSAAIAKASSGYAVAGVLEPVSVFLILWAFAWWLRRNDESRPNGRPVRSDVP